MENFSRKTLEQRIAAVSDEIRHYPTPIAHCDLQLSALLEERSFLLKKLEDDNDGGSNAA